MDGCGSRPTNAMQDTCFTSCEGKNNICAERAYGKRPSTAVPRPLPREQSDVKDALAKDTSQPPAAEPEQTPLPSRALRHGAKRVQRQPLDLGKPTVEAAGPAMP